MTQIKEEPRLRMKEVARVLGCSVKFVRLQIREGNIASVERINSRVINIPRSSVDAFRRVRTS